MNHIPGRCYPYPGSEIAPGVRCPMQEPIVMKVSDQS
jgi:hypothetical protein